MNKKILIFGVVFIFLFGFLFFKFSSIKNPINISNLQNEVEDKGGPKLTPHPLSIESLRQGEYPGSDLVVEQTLEPGSNYERYIVSYKSEGLKIYALLTVPDGDPSTGSGQGAPENGWPAIVFNHGFIPPDQYRTTERYIAYTDAFSRNGYILIRPDYRGHGNSEGEATGGYSSNAYTIDVLNAVSSLKKYPGVNTEKIGMWGHSMGGFITLRAMVVSKDLSDGSCCAIKAGVIWGGVVASYADLVEKWRRNSPTPSFMPGATRGGWRQGLIEQYGQPKDNPDFWNSISANAYLKDQPAGRQGISGPLQLHHGEVDTSVPVEFSRTLETQMKDAKKEVELFTYPDDDHDITSNFGIAMQRSVEFFDKYLKD